MELFCANSQEVLLELEAAIEEHSLYDVLRCFCEAANHGVDLTDPLPSSVRNFAYFEEHTGPKFYFLSNYSFSRVFTFLPNFGFPEFFTPFSSFFSFFIFCHPKKKYFGSVCIIPFDKMIPSFLLLV